MLVTDVGESPTEISNRISNGDPRFSRLSTTSFNISVEPMSPTSQCHQYLRTTVALNIVPEDSQLLPLGDR